MKTSNALEIIKKVKELGIDQAKSHRNPSLTVEQEIKILEKALSEKDLTQELSPGLSKSLERFKDSYFYLGDD
jgi:hypothetical protein